MLIVFCFGRCSALVATVLDATAQFFSLLFAGISGVVFDRQSSICWAAASSK